MTKLQGVLNKAVLNGYDVDKWEGFVSIFSHDFAKAFWKPPSDELAKTDRFWKRRLQEMVVEEEPIKFLERWL